MHADPLTIAYIAVGAADAITKRGHDAVASVWKGAELDLISEVIAWAGLLDALAENAELIDCFAYEVAQPFGEELTHALLSDAGCNPLAVAPVLALSLLQEAGPEGRRTQPNPSTRP